MMVIASLNFKTRIMIKFKAFAFAFLLATCGLLAQGPNLSKDYEKIEGKVIDWRHDIHQNPELGNREFKTAEKIAKHLKSLGIEVQTGVAHTGVVGLLKGEMPGKVVALRADIDALPVTERNDLPFKSTVTSEFLGEKVGVMHACGHDTHTAILMGVAEILANNKDKIKGTVKFVFQPAEEGPPPGEEGGALLMVKEGVMKGVDAIFGLHINSQTVGKIKSGVRFNIIPESAEMIGTIRTLDYDMKDKLNKRMVEMVETIAKAYGGTATCEIKDATDITYNDPALVSQMLPTLQRVAGGDNVVIQKAITGAEDFSYFQREAPGFFFFLGGMTPGNTESFPHHTPDFLIDDAGMQLGVKAMTELTLDYLNK